MKILVIGLGSMGKRRIRVLKKYIERETEGQGTAWKIIGVEWMESRRIETEREYGIPVYETLEKAISLEHPDAAIISSSPLSHAELIRRCLQAHLHVFTELNLITNLYDENIALAEQEGKILFLSSTFLYRKEMQYIKEKIQERKFRGGYRYHVGQYLPEWHPWENYRDFFIGQRETNACRELFAIELPWLLDMFGSLKRVQVLCGKLSKLKIDFPDTYQVLMEHENGIIGNLTVEVSAPGNIRALEIWEEDFSIRWNGTPDSLEIFSAVKKEYESIPLYDSEEHEARYASFIVENAYYEEIRNFIRVIQGKEKARYSFTKDKEILNWVDRIEAGKETLR